MTDETDSRRRALAFNAVGPAINSRGYWLPLSARRAVADAVLEAVAGEPAEHCGAIFPAFEGAPPTECILRPGHQGSHANEYDTRWIAKAAAGYCPHCGRGDAGPTADQYEQARRRAIRIQTLLDEQRDRARKDAAASRESERILQQQIDDQAREIDRLQAADRRVRNLADQWFVGGPTSIHIQAGKDLFAALEPPKESPDA